MLNTVAIMGRIVADPQLRQTNSGKSVAGFRIAVDGGKKDAPANFFDVIAWERSAEFVAKYFQKGSMIALSGNLQSRQYQDKSGNKRTAIEIVARDVSFCGDKTNHTSSETRARDTVAASAETADANEGKIDDFSVIEDGEDLPF